MRQIAPESLIVDVVVEAGVDVAVDGGTLPLDASVCVVVAEGEHATSVRARTTSPVHLTME